MKQILVSYFGPFGNVSCNASQSVACLLPRNIAGAQITTVQLPVEFAVAADRLADAVGMYRPDAVVMLGHAARRTAIGLERTARNDACTPAELHTQLPVDAFAAKLAELCPTIALVVSESAGRYVCNDLYYRTLRRFPALPSLFVHLPPDEVIPPACATEAVRRLIELIVR